MVDEQTRGRGAFKMESRAGAQRSGEGSNAGEGYPTVLNRDYSYMDGSNLNRGLGKRTLQRIGGSYDSFYRSGVQAMITNTACYFILAFCAVSQFFMGAYIHVSHEMIENYRKILTMSLVELSNVEVIRYRL